MTGLNFWTNQDGRIHLYIYFEKDFDTSPTELLKSKLFRYGICGKSEMDRLFCSLDNSELLKIECSQIWLQFC